VSSDRPVTQTEGSISGGACTADSPAGAPSGERGSETPRQPSGSARCAQLYVSACPARQAVAHSDGECADLRIVRSPGLDTQSERDRAALNRQPAPRMPRPPPDHRTAPPPSGPVGLPRALQDPPPGTEPSINAGATPLDRHVMARVPARAGPDHAGRAFLPRRLGGHPKRIDVVFSLKSATATSTSSETTDQAAIPAENSSEAFTPYALPSVGRVSSSPGGAASGHGKSNPVWWVLPLAVVVALPISLWRAGAASRRPPRSARGPRKATGHRGGHLH
jgi:hypothetical protein